jgi:hypothetical protein
MFPHLPDQAPAAVAGIVDPGWASLAPRPYPTGITDAGYNKGAFAFPRLGLRTNSPPQFGQTLDMPAAQGPQKVHS